MGLRDNRRGKWRSELSGVGGRCFKHTASLWQSEFLITPRKAKLMRRSWAEVFRNEALVLIERAVRSDVQEAEPCGTAQGDVRSDGHVGGGVGVQSAGTTRCGWRWRRRTLQKTLQTSSAVDGDDGGRLAFSETTDRMIEALGVRTGKQRLDSTHVMTISRC